MSNTAGSDFANAIKNNPNWKSLQERTDEQADEAHIEPDLVREAYNEAWNAGHQAGETVGYRQATIEGGDEGCRFGV